jgi:branched-chain amino acid transport system ATP-binding protein
MTADSPLPALIEVNGLSASYGHVAALKPLDLRVEEGEFVTVLGPNGAGKTTLLRAMSRLIASDGKIKFKGEDITAVPTHRLAKLGIIMVQEGRGLFGEMTVQENLLLGAFRPKARAQIKANMDFCFESFPRLAERKSQLAGSMSGGEQQMLALARALMLTPKILLVDEPSVGLAPQLVSRTIDAIKLLKDHYQLTVLMAEQNFTQAIRIADRGYVIVHGKIAFEGRSADELNNNDLVRKLYMGM